MVVLFFCVPGQNNINVLKYIKIFLKIYKIYICVYGAISDILKL